MVIFRKTAEQSYDRSAVFLRSSSVAELLHAKIHLKSTSAMEFFYHLPILTNLSYGIILRMYIPLPGYRVFFLKAGVIYYEAIF